MKSKASNCAMPSRKLDAVLFWFKKQVGPTDHYTLNLWTQLNKWSHWPVYSQLLWKLKNRILHPSGQLLQGVSLQVHQPGMGTVKRCHHRIAPESDNSKHIYKFQSRLISLLEWSLHFRVLGGRRYCPGDEDGLENAQPEDPETGREVWIVKRREHWSNENELRDHSGCGKTWGGFGCLVIVFTSYLWSDRPCSWMCGRGFEEDQHVLQHLGGCSKPSRERGEGGWQPAGWLGWQRSRWSRRPPPRLATQHAWEEDNQHGQRGIQEEGRQLLPTPVQLQGRLCR